MSENQKDLAVQSYEKKIVTSLREEKYPIPSFVRNKDFLDNLSISGRNVLEISNKFYRDKINKLHENYINDFNAIVIPIIAEKGITSELPEEEIYACLSKYEARITRFIEILQLASKITQESFYDQSLIGESWSLCLNSLDYLPFMLSLGSKKIIILDENFKMDLMFFAALGAMPDVRPIAKAGNIAVPPETYSITLQMMVNNQFQQISIILFKQRFESISRIIPLMSNIGLVVDVKADLDQDFSGLRWVKNSFQYSLFKKKEFLELSRNVKMGGLIIDKSVSPMQVQKIPTLVRSPVNLNIGFEIQKIGTLQYSILQKKDAPPLTYDPMEELICRIPDFVNNLGGGDSTGHKFSTM